jgi:hypothetical protein
LWAILEACFLADDPQIAESGPKSHCEDITIVKRKPSAELQESRKEVII